MPKSSASSRKSLSLSVVIAATGPTAALENGLVSVLENRTADSQVVIVLNRPYDDPYHLRDEVEFVDAPRRASLIECLNQGLAASHGDIVLLLASGAELAPATIDMALSHFQTAQVAAVAPLIVHHLASDAEVRSAGLEYGVGGIRRARHQHLAAAEVPNEACDVIATSVEAAFYRRSALDALGLQLERRLGAGFADIDLGLQLHAAGYATVFEPSARVALPTPNHADLGSSFGQGRQAEQLFWRNARLWGWRRALLAHAACCLGEAIGTVTSLSGAMHTLGRLSALPSIVGCRRHWQLLDELAAGTLGHESEAGSAARIDAPHVRSRRDASSTRAKRQAE
ncbi:MAG: glycosyltransferase family 2 protein [Planctomycetes bacterium]|nr:glycosyltransferase family 2 protein [Planctomycetota bacterium]